MIFRSPAAVTSAVSICTSRRRNSTKTPLFITLFKYFSRFNISFAKLFLLVFTCLFIYRLERIIFRYLINRNFYCTSGIATKATRITAITRLIQNSHRRKVKYEATAEPKCDSISFMRNSHGISHV